MRSKIIAVLAAVASLLVGLGFNASPAGAVGSYDVLAQPGNSAWSYDLGWHVIPSGILQCSISEGNHLQCNRWNSAGTGVLEWGTVNSWIPAGCRRVTMWQAASNTQVNIMVRNQSEGDNRGCVNSAGSYFQLNNKLDFFTSNPGNYCYQFAGGTFSVGTGVTTYGANAIPHVINTSAWWHGSKFIGSGCEIMTLVNVQDTKTAPMVYAVVV